MTNMNDIFIAQRNQMIEDYIANLSSNVPNIKFYE